jgi:hypothetical protein
MRISTEGSSSASVRYLSPVELVINAAVTVLYPIASALINLTSVACVIHATQQDGVHNWTDYRVLLLSEFFGSTSSFHSPSLDRRLRLWRPLRIICPSCGYRSSESHSPKYAAVTHVIPGPRPCYSRLVSQPRPLFLVWHSLCCK